MPRFFFLLRVVLFANLGLLLGVYLVDEPWVRFARTEVVSVQGNILIEVPFEEAEALPAVTLRVREALALVNARTGLSLNDSRLRVRVVPFVLDRALNSLLRPGVSSDGTFRQPWPLPFGSYGDLLVRADYTQGGLTGPSLEHELTHALIHANYDGNVYRALNEGYAAWVAGDSRIPTSLDQLNLVCLRLEGATSQDTHLGKLERGSFDRMAPELYGAAGLPFRNAEARGGVRAARSLMDELARRSFDDASFRELVHGDCASLREYWERESAPGQSRSFSNTSFDSAR